MIKEVLFWLSLLFAGVFVIYTIYFTPMSDWQINPQNSKPITCEE